MRGLHGLGLHRRTQIGGHALRGIHFQSLRQNGAEESEGARESQRQRAAAHISSQRRKVRQRGAKEGEFVKNSAQAKLSCTRHERKIVSLRDLSARVGGDPLLVQASNGNTSIKLNGILWIKASGKWLAHAMQEEMFVPLELAEVKQSIQNETEIASPYTPNDELRPSIETAMHAVLPHRVVLHVHSINAITCAIRLDGPDLLTERLAGLQWQWIPYAAS